MNKRIILVGPSCSGKSFLRKKLEGRGFKCDVSYTSRKPRKGEIDGVHYHFIGPRQFETLREGDFFYEWIEYNGNYYGTGLKEWNEFPLFIMETGGIKHIKPEDRKTCFIIYLNPPFADRYLRMRDERLWDEDKINDRIYTDNKKFNDFKDYDMIITNPRF